MAVLEKLLLLGAALLAAFVGGRCTGADAERERIEIEAARVKEIARAAQDEVNETMEAADAALHELQGRGEALARLRIQMLEAALARADARSCPVSAAVVRVLDAPAARLPDLAAAGAGAGAASAGVAADHRDDAAPATVEIDGQRVTVTADDVAHNAAVNRLACEGNAAQLNALIDTYERIRATQNAAAERVNRGKGG